MAKPKKRFYVVQYEHSFDSKEEAAEYIVKAGTPPNDDMGGFAIIAGTEVPFSHETKTVFTFDDKPAKKARKPRAPKPIRSVDASLEKLAAPKKRGRPKKVTAPANGTSETASA